MKGNFAKSLARVLVYEGGYSNNPKDPGGVTDKGITQGTYNAWLSKRGESSRAVKGISDEDVASIYKTEYWDRIHGDELPSGVDFCMFDAAVNSGVGGSTTWAQNVVNVNPDGSMGNTTLEAIQADDAEDFIRAFCSRRLGTLKRLRTWPTFGKGWSARIANVQKTALAMAASADDQAPDPVLVSTAGGNSKARMSDVPISKTSAIATHAATVGGAVATATAATTQSLGGISDTFAWIKYVLGGLTIVGAVSGLVVLISKSANDAASNGAATAKVDPDADAEFATVKSMPTPAAAPVTAAATPVKNAEVKP
jgi:lysozyme family protein